ncbi:hypothetical protein FACS189421_03990 [Bacteroidia bacterium]|jgi:hypothetical protein|nr:hypothetical protein FACS189421_03990 [Bacteroidia bacterium]GHT48142.1 hypothetical protein FACS189440_10970 [Bacteroidia bacterium]
MIDDDELKARVDGLIDDLNYYLRNYRHLIGHGYSKSALDGNIQLLINEIRWLQD